MKKFLALFISLMMVVLPMAAMAEAAAPANATVATIAIEGGDTYTASFGSDAEGDFVITATIGNTDISAQFGTETAYVNVMGMNISVDYADLASIASEAGAAAGTEVPEIDEEAMNELSTKLTEDLLPLITLETLDNGLNASADLTLADVWSACGDDLTAWIEANESVVDTLLASVDDSLTAEDLISELESADTDTLSATSFSFDFGYTADASAPATHLDLSVASNGESACAVKFAADMSGLSFTADSNGMSVSFLVSAEADGTYGVYMDDTKLATVSVTEGTAPMERFTDGSDATPLADLMTSLMSMYTAA